MPPDALRYVRFLMRHPGHTKIALVAFSNEKCEVPLADANLIKMPCQNCGKKVGIRNDQLGRRVRCPSCRTTFRTDFPDPSAIQPSNTISSKSHSRVEEAEDGGEIVSVGPPRRATASATFPFPPLVVYEATAFAVRRAGAEVTEVDRANYHVKFVSPYGIEHAAYVFPGPTGGSELDIRAAKPGGPSDELLYSRIAQELADYLKAHASHASLSAEKFPLPLPPAPLPERPKRRPSETADGFAIGAIVASAIGVAMFCIPIAAVPLGIVGIILSGISLSQPRSNRGLAISALVLGIVAVVISGLLFLALFANALNEQEKRRGSVSPVIEITQISNPPLVPRSSAAFASSSLNG
jgi:hypothetical protein